MGVCPKDANDQNAMPTGAFGWNVDIRQLTKGTTLYLAIEGKSALFNCGDGEVCGTQGNCN